MYIPKKQVAATISDTDGVVFDSGQEAGVEYLWLPHSSDWTAGASLEATVPELSHTVELEGLGEEGEDCLDEFFSNFLVSLDSPHQDPEMVNLASVTSGLIT